jgi:hypothetical protein
VLTIRVDGECTSTYSFFSTPCDVLIILYRCKFAAETRDNWIACVAYQGEISHCFSLPSASSTLTCFFFCMGKQFHLYSQNID